MSKDEQGYNGWANYETWVASLHIDNEQGTYEEVRRIVADAIAEGAEDGDNYPAVAIADLVREWADETYIDAVREDRPSGLALDLLGHAFARIDWYEIARGYIAELAEAL